MDNSSLLVGRKLKQDRNEIISITAERKGKY